MNLPCRSEFQFRITGRIPSKKNSKNIIRNKNRMMLISSKKYLAWESEQITKLKLQKPASPLHRVSSIRIEFTWPDARKKDLTNAAEGVMDVLVRAGIIEDDCWQVVQELILVSMGKRKYDHGADIFIKL